MTHSLDNGLTIYTNHAFDIDGKETGFGVKQVQHTTKVWNRKTGETVAMPRDFYRLGKPEHDAKFIADFQQVVCLNEKATA